MKQVEYRLAERFLPGTAQLRAARLQAALTRAERQAGGGGAAAPDAVPERAAAEADSAAAEADTERGDAGCGRPSTVG